MQAARLFQRMWEKIGEPEDKAESKCPQVLPAF